MKPKPAKPPRHYRKRTEDEPGHITRYFAPCGANGTASRDYSLNLDAVNCLKCWTVLKIKRSHHAAR